MRTNIRNGLRQETNKKPQSTVGLLQDQKHPGLIVEILVFSLHLLQLRPQRLHLQHTEKTEKLASGSICSNMFKMTRHKY